MTLFDMTLLDESGHDFVELPSPDPTNPGVVRPSKQLLVRIERRRSETIDMITKD